MQLSDKWVSLWQNIQQGDKEALFELYDDMYFHLVRYGLTVHPDSDLVKDSIGELFLKLWDRHQKLNDVKNVQSYLFTSLRRQIQDYLSAEGRINTSILQMQSGDTAETSYEEKIIAREKDEELKLHLDTALKALSPRQIELIRMKFYDNLSYQEIASLSSQNIKTSYNIIYDAVKVLRLKLKM